MNSVSLSSNRESELNTIEESENGNLNDKAKCSQTAIELTANTTEAFEVRHDTPKISKKTKTLFKNVKIVVLVSIWAILTGILMFTNVKELIFQKVSVPFNESQTMIFNELPSGARFALLFRGAFDDESSNNTHYLYVRALLVDNRRNDSTNSLNDQKYIFSIPISERFGSQMLLTENQKSHIFHIDQAIWFKFLRNTSQLHLHLYTNMPTNFPIDLAYDATPIDKSIGVIYAALLLIGLYVMIIWDIVNRTIAAMFMSTLSIALLAMLNERPAMTEIMSWIDSETLLLLFGMMIIVAIMSETGIFDYLAVYAFKITKGRFWPLVTCLCLFTAVLAALLDNVSTMLLMVPVTIRLCVVMELNPIPILMSMVIFSNIGGAATPVGDPPNVIIASNSYVIKNGVNFFNFTVHMTIGVVLVMVQTFIQLRYKFRNVNRTECAASPSPDDSRFEMILKDLEEKYFIRNVPLLIKSTVTLSFVVIVFFLHALPEMQRLSLGWTALLGATLLLILVDRDDFESVLLHVEWSTLLFFASLFVLMESLAKLGLIEWIGSQTENAILAVNEEARLAVTILIILWVSAIASAFVDNIPLTTMMIKVLISLVEKRALNLPLHPLVWALSFGACLGGNGTLIGASANIVCAGVAEQHGYRFTFIDFMKVGFPVMIVNLIVASGYLLVAHVVLGL